MAVSKLAASTAKLSGSRGLVLPMQSRVTWGAVQTARFRSADATAEQADRGKDNQMTRSER